MKIEVFTSSLNMLVVEHFDSLATLYDQKAENRNNYLGRINNIVVKYINDSGIQNPVILDAGTGTGTRLAALKERMPDSKMFAIDISSSMLARAKAKNIEDLALADMARLPTKNETFDYIFCFFNAFGYVPSQTRRLEALKEFYRVLKPGGTVIIDVLNRWHTGEGINFKKTKKRISQELFISQNTNSLEKGDVLFNIQIKDDVLPGYFHSFTKRESRDLFKQAGFTIEDFQIIGYDSGQSHSEINKGNFLYILKKSKT